MDINAIAGAAMRFDAARLDTVSQNIANLTTPGYKRVLSVSSSFNGMVSAGMELKSSPAGANIDATAGALHPSSNVNDIAIEGSGFFTVGSSEAPSYTRQGNLRVSVNGLLVGSQNLPVLGMAGAITLGNAPFSINSHGEVLQSGEVVGQLKIVQFDHSEKLVPLGNALYAQGDAGVTDKPSAYSIRSKFSEASNVNSSEEMVRLSETVRHFEALQKIVQGYDESLEQTIRKLGDF